MKHFAAIVFLLAAAIRLHAQGYIIPSGIIHAGLQDGLGYEVDVLHYVPSSYYTGFFIKPTGKTPPSIFTNTFSLSFIVDVGVRVFLVSSNNPFSLQPILSSSYQELSGSVIFTNNSPFYLGFYTGNQFFAPTNGIYDSPLFGWAKFVNNQGVIQMLDSAIEFGGEGIYVGTQTIIQPTPEPSALALAALGGLLLGWVRRQKTRMGRAEYVGDELLNQAREPRGLATGITKPI
jgi:hypothetical protein